MNERPCGYPARRAPRVGVGFRPTRRSACAAILLLCLLAAGARIARAEPREKSPDAVVLLHGLARTDRSMGVLAERLADEGYRVHNLRYPSTTKTPEELVRFVDAQVQACCEGAPRLHFVTHSLGGILVRAYIASERPPNLGRVVMLAPPNQGSEIVDAIGDTALFAWFFGPTGQQLGTGDDLPSRLPPPDYEVGIIAGTASLNPIGSALVPGDDDGTVSVERTKLEGMTDHITVDRSHALIMRADEVCEQVLHFLDHGAFSRPVPETD